MVAPNNVTTEANSITADILISADQDKLFEKIGRFSKEARIDLELADLNLESTQELKKLLVKLSQ